MTSRLRGPAPVAPHELEASIARGVRQLRLASGADLVFGGPLEATGSGRTAAIGIRSLEGNLGRSLQGLRVVTGSGLGGKALALGRPIMIRDYFNSPDIVHDYDHAVAPERIATVMAVPVLVGGALRGLFYVASRADVPLTSGVVRQAVSVAQTIERDLLVEQAVRRRLAPSGHASRIDRTSPPGRPSAPCTSSGQEAPHQRSRTPSPRSPALLAELDDAIAAVSDQAVRRRLEDVTGRLLGPRVPAGPSVSGIPSRSAVTLTPREHDVLHHVAAGLANEAVADALGLRITTVKAYLKTAARKLGASNRVHAVRLAEELGLLS